MSDVVKKIKGFLNEAKWKLTSKDKDIIYFSGKGENCKNCLVRQEEICPKGTKRFGKQCKEFVKDWQIEGAA